MTTPQLTLSAPRGAETRVIASVSAAHFVSHFYFLVLPPLFVFVRDRIWAQLHRARIGNHGLHTNPGKLAIEGGSNGGLLMGAALTQAPKLFRAVVSHVGVYDMLRVETSANGQFNTVEFGTVKVPAQFKALYAYSPYHHVKDKTRYPAILVHGGERPAGGPDAIRGRWSHACRRLIRRGRCSCARAAAPATAESGRASRTLSRSTPM